MMESGVRFEDFNQSFLERTFMRENLFSPYQSNLNSAWNAISQVKILDKIFGNFFENI